MKQFPLALALVLAFSVFAEDPVVPPPTEPAPSVAPEAELKSPQIVDIFSVSEAPGIGALTYKVDENLSEKINFGKDTGLYGVGLVFNGKVLPEPFKTDFQKNEILQLALGNLKSKEEGHSPQFGAVTLLASKIPVEKTVFRLTLPNAGELKKGPTAILLFTSPNLKTGATDEEKLKETLFAESGSILVTPVGLKTTVVLKSKTGKYTFFKRNMKLDWAANLATPFSTAKRSLIGTTEFAFFWPKDNEAGKLATKIASESLSSVGLNSKGSGAKKK